MRKPQLCPYEITRRYMNDNRSSLDDAIYLHVLGKVRARDFKALAGVTCNFDMHSLDVEHWRVLRQVEAFFKKNSDMAEDGPCTEAALASFYEGERQCQDTNQRLFHYYSNPELLAPDVWFSMERAQDFIAKVLGPLESFVNEIPRRLRVTSGASACSPRSKSLPHLKFKRSIPTTYGCMELLKNAYLSQGYAPPKMIRTTRNRVTFVPKSWKTHRTIACEPIGNLPFQLAFDSYVKDKLRRFGVDLRHQDRNQELARIGSIDGSLSTIDLSMASDTLSLELVAWLLPYDWFKWFLMATRSPEYALTVNGETVFGRYAKFSSMGNGTTFVLETLIFRALLEAVGSKRGTCYGDDIIVETELAPALLSLLDFVGFRPNVEKSYTSGPFRESCGCDYFNGRDITPFYLRSTRAWDIPYACHNVNGLARIATYGSLWEYLATFIKDAKLPLCAVEEDTQSGVHIHPYYAYSNKLMRPFFRKKGDQITTTKRFIRKNKVSRCWDSRSLALWFMAKLRSDVSDDTFAESLAMAHLRQTHETSRYTTNDFAYKFERRWVPWIYPRQGVPEELFSFSEYLFRES